MTTYYLGSFPPPYGGVTIKNYNLLTALSVNNGIKKIDFSKVKRKNIAEFFRMVKSLLDKNCRYIVGVSGRKTRRSFCKLLYTHNRESMSRSVMFVMGGTFGRLITDDPEYIRYASQFKCIYIETEKMKRELNAVGLENVKIFPNCRLRPATTEQKQINTSEKLRIVFFAKISVPKGAQRLLSAAEKLGDRVMVDFYGEIDGEYEESFLSQVEKLKNVEYKGVFNSQKEDSVALLSKYDLLVFPSAWEHEGVPGTLVEGLIAGTPCIVSDFAYNAEIIQNNVSGIVLCENTPDAIVDAVSDIDNDRELLKRLSVGAREASENYFFDKYIPIIEEELK